jgi:hypothetical protein
VLTCISIFIKVDKKGNCLFNDVYESGFQAYVDCTILI